MPKTAGAVRRKVKTPAEGRTKLTQNFVNLSVCGQRGFSDKRKNAVTANPILNKTGGKPFMAKVELKQPVVAEIAEVLNGAKSAVVVDYRGLTVEQDTALRKQLREAGVSYKVYKNTMIRFAAKGTEFEALEPHLEGPTALAVSKEDATAPARVLAEFAKKADKLELKGGVVEGTYYDAAGRCNRKHPVQRGSSWKTSWKHAVPDHKLRSCSQPDRREERRRRRSSGRGLILIPVLQAETRIA